MEGDLEEVCQKLIDYEVEKKTAAQLLNRHNASSS